MKEGDVDYRVLHEQAKINTNRKQTKAKRYTDRKRWARKVSIEEGIKVLVKQEKKNKYSTVFDSVPLIVIRVKGTMVTARDLTSQSPGIYHISRGSFYEMKI